MPDPTDPTDPTDPYRATEHPLASLPALSRDHVDALKSHWLVSAEQVLAASASPGGRDGLKALLSLDDAGLGRLLEELASVVGPEAAGILRRPAAGGALGVRLTEQQQKRFGLE